MKTLKERDNLDLLELVCQLHSRALGGTKEMDDTYVDARQELEMRLQVKIKPIFLIGMPCCTTEKDLIKNQREFINKMDEYHVIVYINNKNEFEFQVLYEKDFKKVNLKELKKIIKKYGSK